MAKGYWIAFYRSVSNPYALTEYAKLATPAIQAGGGRFIARGTPYRRYEAGLDQRSVVQPVAYNSARGSHPTPSEAVRGRSGDHAGARPAKERMHRPRTQPSQRAVDVHRRRRA